MQQQLIVIDLTQLEEVVSNCMRKAISQIREEEFAVPEADNEDLMTINEVAEYFRRSRQTIHSWKKQGLLPFYRISRKIYFKKRDVLSALLAIESGTLSRYR